MGDMFGLTQDMTPKDVSALVETKSLPELRGMTKMFMDGAQRLMADRQMKVSEGELALREKAQEAQEKQFGQTLEEKKTQFDQTMEERRHQFETSTAMSKEQFEEKLAEDKRQFDTGLGLKMTELQNEILMDAQKNRFSGATEGSRKTHQLATRVAESHGTLMRMVENGFSPSREWFKTSVGKSAEEQIANTAMTSILAGILRGDTGAAITPQEFELYGPMLLPTKYDKQETRDYKLNKLYGFTQNLFQSSGIENWQQDYDAAFKSGAELLGNIYGPANPVDENEISVRAARVKALETPPEVVPQTFATSPYPREQSMPAPNVLAPTAPSAPMQPAPPMQTPVSPPQQPSMPSSTSGSRRDDFQNNLNRKGIFSPGRGQQAAFLTIINLLKGL
tara:strand:- start:396 stop:1574 length:1179 start_codon:yes stop_codon:yes gene_type:complete